MEYHTIPSPDESAKGDPRAGRQRILSERERRHHAIPVRQVPAGEQPVPEGADAAGARQSASVLQHGLLLQLHQPVHGNHIH